ncbi:efflux RND transporter permease subunit [Myxococcota bacterium]|nr:efflux RND transporter permease subunit [Myxococcota bacterium]
MNISELAVRRRQFTLVVFLALVGLGVSSMLEIPRAEDPSFSSPNFGVVAVFPGASPKDVEELVVDPLEAAFSELDDLKRLKTRIEDGVAVIAVEFEQGVDSDAKYDEVIRQVNVTRPKLPSGIYALDVQRYDPTSVAIAQVALVSETAPYPELERIAKRLAERLETIRGSKEGSTWAHPEQEVRVAIDPERLARTGVPLDQVMRAIQSDNANVPGGSVELGRRRLNVKTSGPYTSVEEIGRTVVGGAEGRIVRLEDVATVTHTTQDETYVGRFDGKRAVFVTMTAKDRQNIFQLRDDLEQLLDETRASLPPGITLERGFDQAKNVEHRLRGLTIDFALAILLVLVTLLPLGFRAAVVVMISIPLSLAMGLTMLHFTGYSINQLSIVGFVIALGLLVDDSIVVTENITRFLRMGHSRMEAAILGTKQIGVAVLGCTATLIFAFVPLLFLPGNAGAFIRSMPLAVVFTIAASLFVSLTIIPLLASTLLSSHHEGESWIFRMMTSGIERSYRPVLRVALARPKTTAVAAAALFAVSLALIPVIGFSLFPKAGTPQFLVTIEAPDGASLAATDEAARFAEAVLAKRPEIAWTMTNVGKGNPRIYYNLAQAPERSNVGEIFVEGKRMAPDEASKFFDGLRAELATYPGAKLRVTEFENGPPVEAPIAIRVMGEDLDVLATLAARVEDLLRDTEGTRDVNNPLAIQKSDLAVKADPDKAGLLGVPMASVDQTIRMALAGLEVSKYRTSQGDEHPIVVTVQRDGRATLDALEGLHATSVTGASIPLAQLVKTSWESSPSLIQHYDKERSVTVTAFVRTGFNTDRVTRAVLASLAAEQLPAGYRWKAAGEIESREESFGGLGTAIIVAIFGVLAVLVLEFKTFKSTLIVASVIPLGVMGGVVALFLTGNTLSFTATIGFIALIGIEVKNSILLVDFTNQLREEGKSIDEAIQKAGEIRFFPILLTTMTAIGGLLPLALAGSSLYSPLAWVIIGGLVTSTILSRLVTPVMYKLLAPDVEPTPIVTTNVALPHGAVAA